MAILKLEPEEARFTDLLLTADRVRLSAATLLEVQLVAAARQLSAELEELLELTGAEVVPFDERQAKLAFDGFKKFGKGRHPARLNFGDCFSYAAAQAFSEPLLFKGGDFSKTDVLAADAAD